MERSLNVGAVIDRIFKIYVDQASVLLPAAAVVFVLTAILSEVLIAAAPVLVLVALVISLVATTLFTGMVVELVADVQDGRRDATVGQLLGAVKPAVGSLILVGIIAGLAIGIGLVLIVVPGLILITIWAVFAPVIVLEHPPGLGALGRSRELVRGNGWQVFAVVFVLVIGVEIVALVIEGIASSAGLGVGIVVRVVVQILAAPLAALAASVLYFELRGPSPVTTTEPTEPVPNPMGTA